MLSLNSSFFKNHILPSALLFLSVWVLYFPVLGYGFLHFDDHLYITQNPIVLNGLSSVGLKWAFLSWGVDNWMPLTWFSHMLDVQFFGLHAGWHHGVNLCFHAVNSVLVFLVFKRMTQRQILSWLVALIFALHPMHVESVAWISERKDVLSTFFVLLSIWAYVESRMMLSCLFFACSVMSKPMYVTLPFLLVIFDFWPLARIFDWKSFQKKLLGKWPYILIALAGGLLALMAQQNAGAVFRFDEMPAGYRFAVIFMAMSNYIQKFIFPHSFSIFYLPFTEEEFQTWGSSTVLVLTGFSIIAAISFRKKSQWVLAAWLLFLVSLLPVLGLIKAGSQSMADRYTYFAYLGLSILLLWTGDAWIKLRPFMRIPLIGALILWLVLCAGKTIERIQDWQSTEKLFQSAVKVDPENYVAYKVLADDAFSRGDLKRAAVYLEHALQVLPPQAESMRPEYQLNLAIVYHQSGRHEEAAEAYQKSTQWFPLRADILTALGDVYTALNRPSQARLQYERALSISPGNENLQNKIAGLRQPRKAETQTG